MKLSGQMCWICDDAIAEGDLRVDHVIYGLSRRSECPGDPVNGIMLLEVQEYAADHARASVRQVTEAQGQPPISGWVCRCAMMWVVLHAPVGR
jgi:hypothetical protein